MAHNTQAAQFERRWPVVLTVAAAVLLIGSLPSQIRILPIWVLYVIGAVMLLPTAVVGFASGAGRWCRIERIVIFAFFVYSVFGAFANLTYVINAMINRSSEITGMQLLTSGVAIWVTNIIMFSLLYWQLDSGGPETRLQDADAKRDFLFPQTEAAGEYVRSDWRPEFVDYLFLGYMTSVAFSPTEAMPMSPRAKLLMMLQSVISLATILIIAARAINILG